MTLSVTIYFPAHCGHTGLPDWGDVPQGRLWVDSRPRRLRPCCPVRSCGPVPFAVTPYYHTKNDRLRLIPIFTGRRVLFCSASRCRSVGLSVGLSPSQNGSFLLRLNTKMFKFRGWACLLWLSLHVLLIFFKFFSLVFFLFWVCFRLRRLSVSFKRPLCIIISHLIRSKLLIQSIAFAAVSTINITQRTDSD